MEAKYQLDADDSPTIHLDTHPKNLAAFQGEPWAERVGEKFGIETFTHFSEQDQFGFNNVAQVADSKLQDDWVRLSFDPTVIIQARQEGQPHPTHAYTGTFEALLDFFAWSEAELETSTEFPPFLEVTIDTTFPYPEVYGCYIRAGVYEAMQVWVDGLEDREQAALAVSRAMQAMDTLLFQPPLGQRPLDLDRFPVMLISGTDLHLDVPGSSCGLDSTDTSTGPFDTKVELVPHNTDSPIQQITLLTGLAKLNGLALNDYQKGVLLENIAKTIKQLANTY